MKFDTSRIEFSNADLKKGLILPKKLTPELAEECGLHIGDGTMNFYFNKSRYKGKYSLRGHILDDKKHYNSRIKKLYKFLYNLEPPLSEMKSTGVYGFQLWSDCIVNFKRKILGLPLGNKINIKIPNYLINKKEYLVDVIRGIFDTDGCIYLEHKNNKLYPRIQIGTTSKILFKQLRNSISQLGLRVTGTIENREHKGWNNLCSTCIRGDNMFRKWMKVIKPTNLKHILKFNFYRENV